MERPPIELRSTGELIDMLITTSMKMFELQNQIPKAGDTEAGQKSKLLQTLNSNRNDLIRAISKRLDGYDPGTDKTYK